MATPEEGSPLELHTYHCLCSHLLLASTRPLSALSRRSELDQAYILPLPPPPRSSHVDADGISNEYALLLSTTLDRTPIVIRSEEGFEKRYLQRCGRCRLVVGYQLDKCQYEGEEELGRKEDVIYLPPGGLMNTEDMVAGKDMTASIAFDGVDPTKVTAK